jgi:hypothetical protein
MLRQSSKPFILPILMEINGLRFAKRGHSLRPACPLPHHCQTHLTALLAAHQQATIPPVKAVLFVIALLTALFPAIASAQQPVQPTPQQSTESYPIPHDHSSMNDRGEKGMGFSQTTTTHHFFLRSDGGAIQVEANDPKDTATRDSIRAHLTHIAHAFSEGDFDIPMFVHGTTPPGVPEMKRLKDKITYTFRETPAGGRVVIATTDPDALAAIHKFLSFQIDEHHTHDPTTVH